MAIAVVMPDTPQQPRPTAWARALELARQTPDSRNRYVDLLRALSISAVVFGHWLIAAPHVDGGELRLDHMLGVSPWTQWLTWLFQVMPVFFMVGGYSNAASWGAAQRDGSAYGAWVGARLRRLIRPVVPLLLVWCVIAAVARAAGVAPEMIRVGSQAALVPLWFLAVYVLVVLLAPPAYAGWQRFGVASFWALAAAAVVVDVVRFVVGVPLVGWLNYLFVWLAVHQMGFLWRHGRLGGTRSLPWALASGALLVGLVTVGGYPRSMVGVPGEEVSNTLPPSLAMLALGALQAGLLLLLEPRMRRLLARPVPWAATILVNGMIMSVYLWHLTAMVGVIAMANWLGGFGLHLPPGSTAWWLTRPVWMLVLGLVLFGFLTVVGRFERGGGASERAVLPAWRAVVGSVLFCGALALIALDGIGADGPLGIRIGVVLAALVGAGLVGGLPLPARGRYS
jgi:fucose 4-O-acetylase-like acetyltransferase